MSYNCIMKEEQEGEQVCQVCGTTDNPIRELRENPDFCVCDYCRERYYNSDLYPSLDVFSS